MSYFRFDSQRIAYSEFGGGPAAVTAGGNRGRTARSAPAAGRPVILIHGLLLSQTMAQPLAELLAAKGNRVITLDLLGHGKSERPRDMWRYSMNAFARQTIALMDHLELDEAVVMGTSLGANTALEVAAQAPERLRGMVIEMPVLDNALLASAVFFTPILLALTFGEPLMKVLQRGARAIPRSALPHLGNVVLDTVRQDPAPGAAVLQGLFFGNIAPHRELRRTFQTPALVIGHRRDPVHPFSDAGMLAAEMPNARLVEADSLVELRVKPERLTAEIASFLDEAWAPRRDSDKGSASRSAASRRATTRRAASAAGDGPAASEAAGRASRARTRTAKAR